MAIANTAHGGAATSTSAVTTLAITVAIAVGEFVWVTIATVAGTSTTAVSDNSAGGANKYQFFSKKVGASSEISCWFCNKASATATTITATHAASRASGSASTYTGVLGVGQWKDATNAANNNTVTLTNALGSGNLTLAGMGGALSTATWTAVTGTLRNNIAGGGTTTPGSTNIEGSTTTVAASLSSSVSGEAVAIELLSAVLPVAMNLDIENSLAPPIMWSMGGMGDTTRRSLYEVEKESWGLEIELQTYQEDQEYQNIPQQFPPWFDIETEQFDVGLGLIPLPATSFDTEFFPMLCSLYLPDRDTENYNFGFTPQIGGGTQLMGFRGFWSLKAGMGSLEDWSFDSGIVVAAINAFDDVDQAVAQQASGFAADEVERDNWGWLPPMAQVTLDEAHLDHRFRFDGPAELEAITEDFIVEMVSIDELYTGQINISPIYQEDDQFSFQTAVVTTTQPWDGEDNPADRSWSAKQDLDDLSFEPAIWQNPLDESNYDSFIQLNTLWQTTDEDQIQSEFFATDRVPEDYEQFVTTNQLALYWNDDDASQSTFFSQEQYADNDEQFISCYLVRYQEDDVFGFQTATVTVNQPWDAEYNPGFTKLSAVDDIEQWSYEDAIQDVRDELVEITMPSWVRAETESEQFGQNAPFLTSNSEPWEQWGQIANPPYPITHQVELDQHGQQTPFLTAQPFDETDQMGQTWWARDVDDSWSFNTPEIEGELLLEEEIQQGNQPYPLWQQVEDEQYGKQAPFIASQPFDETIDQVGQTWWAREQTEDLQHGQQSPFLTAVSFDDSPEQFKVFLEATDVDDSWGFNTPELLGELILEEEVPMANPPYPVTHQVELDQFGQNAPFLTAQPFDESDQRGDTWWARDVDDNWAFNTPEVEGELLLEEELQLNNQPYPLWQQVEDEQFGKQSPFITSQPFDETIDQIGQTWWTRWQTEDEQFGQNAPFIIPFGFDFILDSYVLSPGALDDVDQFSFQPEISEDLALADEDHFVSMQFLVQEEDVFGMKAPFITSFPSDDSIDQLWNKPYPIVAEDDLVFPASTILANMLYDADFNPTTQQSYYFSSEDLEKYNWGWLPPMTKVAEDDAPYDSRAQIQSFFVPAIEDEQFSWGFDRSRFYALGDEAPYFAPAQQRTYYLPELEDEMFSWGFNQATFPALDQDELPVITAQRMYHEEDFGQQVQFYADSIGDENVTSRYIVSADEDSGMFGLTTTGFTDQLDMSPRNLWSFQEEEPFGFQQQVATAFDDSAEHFPVSARIRDDVEVFGFNPQLPTMDFTLPEERSIEWRMYGEEEIWGFAFAYADGIEQAEGVRAQQIIPTEDQPAWGTDGSAAQGVEAYPSAGRLVAIQDDYEQVAISVVQPFSFGDELDHLPNPPFPITHQLENDQIGQQPPFIISQPFAWEESGVPSNQPWPILDVTDYNDWITNIVFKILRVYDVNIRTVLAVMAILVAQDKVLRQLENGAGYGINVIEATASLAFREVVSVPRFTAQAILGSSLSIT